MQITDRMFVEGIENDTNSVVITDEQGVIYYVNKKFLSLTGYSKNDVIGKHTRILKSGESPATFYSNLWATISSGKIWTGQFHNKKKNGVFFYEDATIIPLFDESNRSKIIGYMAIKKDITEQKISYEQLQEKNRFIERLTQTNPNVVYIYDLNDKRNVYVNGHVFNLLGYTVDEIQELGSELFINIIHPDDLKKVDNYHNGIKQRLNGNIYEIEYRMRHKDGTYKWVLSRDSIFEYENGTPSKIVGIAIDITDRKLYEAELEESNTTKNKLFSIISHDLKNPFSSIVGYTQYLYENTTNMSTDEIQNFSYELLSLSRQVGNLLYNLLDWSKLQANTLQPNKIKINLFDFTQYVFDLLKIISDRKNITLINSIPKSININADEKMLYSILYNLIYNSVKFTNYEGSVTVSAIIKPEYDDRVYISVTDTGIGMSYDNISNLFKIAGQYTTIGTDNEKGSGIGLIIVKEFVEIHDGNIEIKSEVGRGTEFIFDMELFYDK